MTRRYASFGPMPRVLSTPSSRSSNPCYMFSPPSFWAPSLVAAAPGPRRHCPCRCCRFYCRRCCRHCCCHLALSLSSSVVAAVAFAVAFRCRCRCPSSLCSPIPTPLVTHPGSRGSQGWWGCCRWCYLVVVALSGNKLVLTCCWQCCRPHLLPPLSSLSQPSALFAAPGFGLSSCCCRMWAVSSSPRRDEIAKT
jgi:hypothetical protein